MLALWPSASHIIVKIFCQGGSSSSREGGLAQAGCVNLMDCAVAGTLAERLLEPEISIQNASGGRDQVFLFATCLLHGGCY